jgi:hypothetical protein
MFTKPSNMSCQLYKVSLKDQLIDQFELEIPGDKMKTVNSSARIVRDSSFY